jgi:hypothetical protein
MRKVNQQAVSVRRKNQVCLRFQRLIETGMGQFVLVLEMSFSAECCMVTELT